MIDGMTMYKIAVSLPGALVKRARAAVAAGRASSVSAYLAAALEEKVKHDDLDALLTEMLGETGGPPTLDEQREADRLLGFPPQRESAA